MCGILEHAPTAAATTFRSKGVDELPLIPSTSIITALGDAIASVADNRPHVSDSRAGPGGAQRLKAACRTASEGKRDD